MDYFLDGDYSNYDYNQIQSILFDKFKDKRLELIRNRILNAYNVDFDFVKELMSNPINNEYQNNILKSVTLFSLDTAILLNGFMDEKAQISEISEDGIENFNKIGFHTIGSGSMQAHNTLLFQEQSINNDIKTTLYNVYKSKKNAEVMQGVGRKTDIGILSKDSINLLNDENIKILDKIYNLELSYGKKHEELNKLNL